MKLIFILLILISCKQKEQDLEYLDAFLVNNWISATKIEATFPESFSSTRSITSPQMTWKNILKVTMSDQIHCFLYRIPHSRLSKGKGIIKIVKISKNEKCNNVLERKEEMVINNLSHLKIYFSSKLEKNLISKTEFKAFHLYISATRTGDKDMALVLPLYNVRGRNLINPNKLSIKRKVFRRYDSPWENSLRPGLKVYGSEFKNIPNKKINILDYSLNNLRFCYRVDRSCKITQEFNCDTCLNGWYSVVDYKCDKGGSRLCGPSLCGERNQPACPRGSVFEDVVDLNLCFRGSHAGICNEGLETYCDSNNVLVCR